jgi:hypothetical protein
VGTLSFIASLGCMLKFPLEFMYLPFIECDVSTVIQILEFHYLNLKYSVLP